MADNPESTSGGNLPPKLDLRKMGVVKTDGAAAQPNPAPAATGAKPAFTPRIVAPTSGPKPIPLGNLPPMNANTTTPITITPAATTPRTPPAPTSAPLTPKRPSTATITRPTVTPAPKVMGAQPAMSPAAKPGQTPTSRSISSAEPQVQTVHIKIPKAETAGGMVPPGKSEAPTVMTQDRVSPAPAGDPKKETSKIPLAAAKSTVGPTVMSTPPTDGPKTIRIKPKPATAQTQKVAQAGILAADDDSADESAEMSGKRKTSRISLEAALTPDQMPGAPAGAGEAARPKTIRLKRPSEAATVRVSAQPADQSEQAASIAPAAARITEQEPLMPAGISLEETSKLDMPPPAEEEGSPTRRKTIKVKRPTQRPEMSVPTGVGGRPGAGDVGGRHAARAAAVVKPDTMNATFPVFAIITMIVIMVTIYLFCTETLGPNPCLTDYSYYKEGPELSWPGKISPYTR